MTNWHVMKRLIEKRFVPQYYKQELFIKMQTLRQGGFCVEDYIKEFEMLMICCDLQKPQEQTIARFISGLQKEIADAVELQPYVSFEDVIKLAMKIQRERRRSPTKVSKSLSLSSTPTYPSEVVPKPEFKEETTKLVVVDIKGKAKIESSQPVRSRDVKCFKCLGYGHIASQCPNKRMMIA